MSQWDDPFDIGPKGDQKRKKSLRANKEYDFEGDEQGAVTRPVSGKIQITIRIDTDVLTIPGLATIMNSCP
jgi:hypothetical protein